MADGADTVERDKVGRLYVSQAKFEAGRVLFPTGARFLPELEAELLAFPQGKTDQVDSISQVLNSRLTLLAGSSLSHANTFVRLQRLRGPGCLCGPVRWAD